MVKKFEQFVNEDFTKLYGRWSSGNKRKEAGSKVDTKWGTIFLKDRNCDYDWLIGRLLDIENEDYLSGRIYNIHNVGYSNAEKSNIMSNKTLYDFLIEDIRSGLCICFTPYSDLDSDDEGYVEVVENYCEEDYNAICKCVAEYLKNNVTISHVKGKYGDYKLLLYSGDCPDDFEFEALDDEFYNYFKESPETWSFSDEINVGVPISFDNISRYDEMKKAVCDWMES